MKINASYEQSVIARLPKPEHFSTSVEEACAILDLGSPQRIQLLTTGYEDCNVHVQTMNGEFLLKMFSKERSNETIERYCAIIKAVSKGGVPHPPLVEKHGVSLLCAKGNYLVALQYIPGETFYQLGRPPDQKERSEIIAAAAAIHRLDLRPPFLFDNWAIPNIENIYQQVVSFLDAQERLLIEEVINRYRALDVKTLPKAFVHGDLIVTNVLRGFDGKIWFLDFSVSNVYPKIQELAVLCSSLFKDPHAERSISSLTEEVVQEYAKHNELTPQERQALYPYTLAALAMEFLGGNREWYIKENHSEETRQWIVLGKKGLERELRSPTHR